MKLFLLGLLFASSLSAPHAPCPKKQEVGEVRERARTALFGEAPRPTLQLSGRTTRHGSPAEFRWTIDPGGRFLKEQRGNAPQREVFDGTHAWREDGRGPSFRLALLDRERLLAETWVLAGLWCIEDSPFELELLEGKAAPLLRLRLRDGLWNGVLELDPSSHLPRELRVASAFGGSVWSFEKWTDELPRLPLQLLESRSLGEASTYAVSDAGAWERRPPDYIRPRRSQGDSLFNNKVSPRLEVKRVESGHLCQFLRRSRGTRQMGEDLVVKRREKRLGSHESECNVRYVLRAGQDRHAVHLVFLLRCSMLTPAR